MNTLRQKANYIVETLRKDNFEAYFVGGAVRDLLLKKEPKDFDIVTSATPNEMEKVFSESKGFKIYPIGRGKEFGTMLVNFKDESFEVTTFRKEFGYSDGRRPDKVQWTNAKEDIMRRDFTVNGILLDPLEDKVIDYVDGQQDLSLGIVRFIGNPKERINEDPLRIMRAVRLKNSLGFQYDKATFDALRDMANEINRTPKSRVGDELDKMLSHKNRADAVRDLDRLGLLEIILPEIDRLKGVPQPSQYHKEGDVFDHSLKALGSLPPDAPSFLAFATLFHDSGKPDTIELGDNSKKDGGRITTHGHAKASAQIAKETMKRLGFPRTYADTAAWMIEHHMSLKNIEGMRPNKKELFLLDPKFPWLLELHHADALGATPVDLSLYHHDLKLYEAALADREHATKTAKPPLIDGYELQRALKIKAGKIIGDLLTDIRDAQIRGEISTKEEAVELARGILED